jgi:hypothetical protein
MPGGVILRVLTEPTFRTEYLSLDGAKPEWSERRIEAVFFESHGEADARAEALRLALGEHVYAAVATKAIPHAKREHLVTETAGFEPVRSLPPRTKKKTSRSDRDREEMRRRDEAELEETAVFG